MVIQDEVIVTRAAQARDATLRAAKAGAARGGKATGNGVWALTCRYGRGLRNFGSDVWALWHDHAGLDHVEACSPGADRVKAEEKHEKKVVRNRAVIVGIVASTLAWCSGGLVELHRIKSGNLGWVTLGIVYSLIAAATFMVCAAVWRGKHKHGWLWPLTFVIVDIVLGCAAYVHLALAIPIWKMTAAELALTSIWILIAGADGNLLGPGETPTIDENKTQGLDPVAAALATGRLPKDSTPALVQPGVVRSSSGVIWTATLDTGGSSATVLLESRVRAEFAARLGLSSRRLVLTVDDEYGSRIHITGIVGKPWKDGIRHPLMALQPVDLWAGIPWGVTIEGDVVCYRVDGVNSLFGGESGAGKSTALAGVWGAFALAVHGNTAAEIHVIDGGEVDTEPLRRSQLARSWTTELSEGVAILESVLAEIDRRQHLLAQAELRKVTPEFFAEHGIGFLLLAVDELATFTQRKDPEASKFAETLRLIAQRARKTGVHLLLSTQSPSVDALDADARDVIPVRWCGQARSVDLAGKVLGRGAVGRGLDPRDLPDVPGVGWYSAPGREIVVRPYELTDADLKAICQRGVELRRGLRTDTAADDDQHLATRVADLIKAEGVTVGDRRVMLARDVAARLDVDQMQLRAALGRVGVGTQKVWRPDDESSTNRAHYVLNDFPATKVI